MKVGDIVKSLDFNGISDCYLIGKVVAIRSDDTFRAKVIERVWQGSVNKKFKSDYFTAPLQGKGFTDSDESPRIIVVA
jgi:hypothetical protein